MLIAQYVSDASEIQNVQVQVRTSILISFLIEL